MVSISSNAPQKSVLVPGIIIYCENLFRQNWNVTEIVRKWHIPWLPASFGIYDIQAITDKSISKLVQWLHAKFCQQKIGSNGYFAAF